jgi:hypothetical protein
MKTYLNFEDKETKELLSKLDFEFFLKLHISTENYKQADIDSIYASYKRLTADIKVKAKDNMKQFHYFAEGQVRKMFTGGLLPAHFELDECRQYTIGDFPGIGENWAYFDFWQKYQKGKITKRKIWDLIIKTGSILAILLSMIKFMEYLNQYGLGNIFK